MSLGISANKERNGALLAYIAKNVPNVNLRKLLKIVYLIDEKYMQQKGFPLTWFDYYAWEKGPVAPEVYDVKNGAFSEYVRCHENAEGKNIVESILDNKFLVLKRMEVFSPNEMQVIDSVLRECEGKTADELTDLTHEDDSLWSKTVRENEIVFVSGKSDVQLPLTRLNEGDEDKQEMYADAKWNMDFQAALNASK